MCKIQGTKIPHEIHWRWMKNNTLFLHSTLLTWFTVWPSAIHSLASSKHKQPSATFLRIHTHYVQICGIPTELKNARCTAIVYIWSIHNFKAILLDECEWMCIGHIFFCRTLVRWSLTVRIVFTATYLCFCSSLFCKFRLFLDSNLYVTSNVCVQIQLKGLTMFTAVTSVQYPFFVHTRQTFHQWLVSVSISVWIFNSKTDCLPF